jgi:hypothetical protein
MWANPKNWLIIILLVIAVVVGGMYLWQRNTVVKQAGQIDALTISNKELSAQVTTYRKNIADMKRAQAAQQQIANDTNALMNYVNQMKETKCIGGEDEENISVITRFFNAHGVLSGDSGDSADGKSVSETNPPGAGITGWSTKQIIKNYLVLIDYILKVEEEVKCYER